MAKFDLMVGTFGLMAVCAAAVCEVKDGKYWIDVPAGETYQLAADDVAALMPSAGHLDLWKVGEGTLVMATNESTVAFANYDGNIYATNGLLQVKSEYGLGKNTTGQTCIWPGAAFDCAYQRPEPPGSAAKGVTQQETIRVAGTGFGDYGALNETVGNHIMLGKVTLDGDATFGTKVVNNNVHVRYHLLDFGGHQIRCANMMAFGSLPVANVPDVPIVMGPNTRLTFTGTGLVSTESDHVIRFENEAVFVFDAMNSDSFLWGLHFVSNGTILANNVPSSATVITTNTWNGPVYVGGTLTVSFNAENRPLTLNGEVYGGGTLRINNAGTLTLGAANHRIKRLEMTAANRRLRLPEDFVLEVQSLSANGKEMPEGDYTSANLANIVAGTVRVTQEALVYDSGTFQGADYAMVAAGAKVAPQISTDSAGRMSLVTESRTVAWTTFTGLTELLGRARLRVDATAESSFTYVNASTWTSTNGLRGVSRWTNLNDENLYFKNFNTTYQTNSSGLPYRFVSAYPTIQPYTVNGVTRPYVDMGEVAGDPDTAENKYSNSYSFSPTSAGMEGVPNANATCLMAGQEYHAVFGDAHANPTNMNRGSLFGRTNCNASGKPDYVPGRRGADGSIFAQRNYTTEAFRDGRVWADNVQTNSTYAPDWGEVHVYTVIPTNAFCGVPNDFLQLSTIGIDTYARYGGGRYGEMLVYSGATNTLADRARIDAYLMKKWIGKGPGAEMVFDTVTLKDGASLALICQDYDDVGTGYRIGTLAGTGSVSVGAKDSLAVENLAFTFTAQDVCGTITTDASLTFAPSGTVSLSFATGIAHPKAGRYRLFEAVAATNGEALDGWTVVCPDPLVKIVREGSALFADVQPLGVMIILK